MKLRRFEIGDEPALYKVYHSAIHLIASRHYTPEQVQAWAPDVIDPDHWQRRMRDLKPYVVQKGGEVLGYADLQPTGYIDHFFVSGKHQGSGIGTALMRRIHEEAAAMDIPALSSDVSLAAEGFFMRHGFAVTERREVRVRGVLLPNAAMRKELRDLAIRLATP